MFYESLYIYGLCDITFNVLHYNTRAIFGQDPQASRVRDCLDWTPVSQKSGMGYCRYIDDI